MKRTMSRPALGAVLAAVFLTAGVASPTFAQRNKPAAAETVSPGFAKVAAPFQKAVNDAKSRPDVAAAKGNAAALGTALASEKGQIPGLMAAATTPFDKYTAGSLLVTLGQLADDAAIMKQGLSTMIESGKGPNAPQLQFFLGQTNLVLKDYAGAQTALQAAVSGGYRDNDVEAQLAQAYISGGKPAEGMAVLRQAVETKQAANVVAPDNWYRVGVTSAYRAKQLEPALFFGLGLTRNYPTKQNWALAIAVVRDLTQYQAQETLDLMRLMGRTDAYTEGRDYVDYVQVGDARRFPGEVLKVIEAGVASGKVKANDPYIVENKNIATSRLAADRASLPALERDAKASTASLATINAAADTFLSYGEPVKAAEFYQLALSKPGGDAARLNTRLGIALADKGDYAGAQAAFAKVEGPRKPLAQLWSNYAANKAAGK